jgi:hypothetical protein
LSTTQLDGLVEQLQLADELRAGREHMLEPQDLPGRYGRVTKAIDHLLAALKCEAVVGGGWALWRHGYVGRVTQDVDIVLGAANVSEFLRAASVAGFDVLPKQPGRWPKLCHKQTGVTVDIFPEGERADTSTRPAPTTLPHPRTVGGSGFSLRYIALPGLMLPKLGAGRARDESDVIELLRANPGQADGIGEELARIHPDYARAFQRLRERAQEQQDH